MKNSRYKLIALDIDGTLIGSSGVIDSKTRQLLIEIQRNYGVRLVLASGRPLAGILDLAEELELTLHGGFLMPYNGGEVYRANNAAHSSPILTHSLPLSLVKKIYQTASQHKLSIISYQDNNLISEDIDNPYVQKEVEITGMTPKRVEHFTESIPPFVPKCLIVGNPEELSNFTPQFRDLYTGQVDAFQSNPYFLEVVPIGVNKGKSLEWLISYLGYERKEVIAFGDNFNDIEMLQMAGVGVAMQNAPIEVQKEADKVTSSCDEAGVCPIIEDLILEKIPTYTLEEVNDICKESFLGVIGMHCTEISEEGITAEFVVTPSLTQPKGILHGGVSLAFAETIGGLSSMLLLPKCKTQLGMQVNGSHLSSAHIGETLQGITHLKHKGRKTHVWQVDITSKETGKLIHTSLVTNCIIYK